MSAEIQGQGHEVDEVQSGQWLTGARAVADLVLDPTELGRVGHLAKVEIEFLAQFPGENCGDGLYVLNEATWDGVLVAIGSAADQADLDPRRE